MMDTRFFAFLAAAPFALACSTSVPEPKQPLADAESALRAAREVGADTQPAARLQTKLADEQLQDARILIKKGHHERATYVILRARADAELAVALARERNALVERQEAVDLAANTTNAQSAQGVSP